MAEREVCPSCDAGLPYACTCPQPADELRTAAAVLRSGLPASVAMAPMLVMSDGETDSALAWCEDHTNWGGPPPEQPEGSACWNCDTVDFVRQPLAEMVRGLLGSREQLADLLEGVGDAMAFWAPYRENESGYRLWTSALTIARLINGMGGA